MSDFECEEYVFSSNFDSGNLRKVELVRKCSETDVSTDHMVHIEFDLWTTPDCYGTPYENPNRTWFFFSIKGGRPFRNVKLNIRNLNRQAKLFSQGMQPVMRIGENGKWERIKDKPCYATESDCFYISFIHRANESTDIPYYYAFTYPFTYTECLNMLDKFDRKYGKCSHDIEYIINRIAYLEKEEKENSTKKSEPMKSISSTKMLPKESAIIENNMDDMNLPSPTNLESGGDSSSPSISESMYEKMSKRELQNEIYYHRELLIPSLQKRRVELLTISSFHGIQNTFEERLSNLFPEMETPRCRNFKDKKIIFMSSRVHPGETAASFVLNGFLNLILDRKSLIGQTLRQMYVFKIVPFLNPDGVYNGLYRTDTIGQNLNRMYICPQIDLQPSIYAVKKVIKYYHLGYDRFDEDNRKLTPIEPKKPLIPSITLTTNRVLNRTPVKKDEICSTASLYDFVEKLRSETSNIENEVTEVSNQTYSSKETTSSEGEENNSPTTLPSTTVSIQSQGKVFTEKLIPEIKTVAQEPAMPKKLLATSSFSKRSSDLLSRKNSAFKTVFGSNHGGISRSNENKLKDLQNTSAQRPKFKKSLIRKEVKSGHSSNLSLKALNKKNILCCQNIDISAEHSSKMEEGIEKPEKSNLFLYMDFHGHASKKGIFMYGNHFQSTNEAVECMLLPRLMGINCHHFHCDACNFSERNMYRREKRDGLSKEGSGRVAVFKMTGLIKCYTLESNYNTGKYVNILPNRVKEINQKPPNIVPPKYTPAIYEEVGRALGPSILDITNSNSLSRIYNSEFRSIQALRIAIRNEIERHGSQRSVASSGKIMASQQNIKRVKRSSLSQASTSNDVSKENKVIYHNSMPHWELAVPSSSTQSTSISVLQSLNQPSKTPQRPTRCIKRNPLKAHSTNLYGKKDAAVNKKKPKPVALLDSSCNTTKKDHGFPIPPKKVRVSPTHNLSSKESSPPARKVGTESNTSDVGFKGVVSDSTVGFESAKLTSMILPVIGDIESQAVTSSERNSYILSKPDKTDCALTSSVSMTQFYSAGNMSLLKKCTSESVLDLYATKSDLGVSSTSNTNIASYKAPNAVDDAVASCSSRIIVHPSNTKPILTTFRKTKKADNFLLKTGASGGNLTSLNPRMKGAFGGSENSKLTKKKRIIRHDSLIVKRKKTKAKITRH